VEEVGRSIAEWPVRCLTERAPGTRRSTHHLRPGPGGPRGARPDGGCSRGCAQVDFTTDREGGEERNGMLTKRVARDRGTVAPAWAQRFRPPFCDAHRVDAVPPRRQSAQYRSNGVGGREQTGVVLQRRFQAFSGPWEWPGPAAAAVVPLKRPCLPPLPL